jgi:hypothetical protein
VVVASELEAAVGWLSANGLSPRQVAAELGLSHVLTRQRLGQHRAYHFRRTGANPPPCTDCDVRIRICC